MNLTYEAIARRIDHALLLPTMTPAETLAGCLLAARYEVASVCVKPHAVRLAVEALQGSVVQVGTVVGFPHGGQSTANKVAEAREAIQLGATEIDMVVNLGEVLGGGWRTVEDELRQVTQAVKEHQRMIKVIFETCYLTDQQKIYLCEICGTVGVDYVKTSTGFGTGGATRADLVLMKKHSSTQVKLKASGGIRNLQTAIEFVELGAERLGVSRTTEILDELYQQLNLPNRVVSRETSTSTTQPGDTY